MIYPIINEIFHPFLDKWMAHYGITTKARMIHFLAQVAHESIYFTRLEENLNYSASALRKVWPNRFSYQDSIIYQRKPELIANRAYANRGGNGNEQSGDGWRYRGRGGIQITLKDNYEKLSNDWAMDILSDPDMLLEPEWAVRSACWYWWKVGLNKKVDSGASIKDVTRLINPALMGLNDRVKKYEIYEKLF